MWIKINDKNEVMEVSSTEFEDSIEYEGDIDLDKAMFAQYVDGQIVYDEQAYAEMIENRNRHIASSQEIDKIEQWFIEYDRICNEHTRCQRMGVECHHDIAEWDKLAVEKAKRLKELRDGD